MLHTQNLTKEYDGQRALDKLNLSVESGDIYCLLGANGAGKSPVPTNAIILLVMVVGLMLASFAMNRAGETEHLMQG